jgi:ribosomal-protein-alanine N-acetyltransferase
MMVLSPDATNDTPVLVTARLELSPGRETDAESLFPYVHGEQGRAVADNLVWDGPNRVEDIRVHDTQPAARTWVGGGFSWVVWDKDGTVTGTVGEPLGVIHMRAGRSDRECDIGYWLGPPFWGRGLMPEAIRAVVEHAFDLGFEAVAADVFDFNGQGTRVLEKLGFRQVGTTPDHYVKRGRSVDTVRLRVTRNHLHPRSDPAPT